MHMPILVAVKPGEIKREGADDKLQKAIAKCSNCTGPLAFVNELLYNHISTPFARISMKKVNDILRIYYCDEPIEFIDITEDIIKEYENMQFHRVKYTNGTIGILPYNFDVTSNGVIVEKYKGKFKKPMRSHKAKKMKYIGCITEHLAYNENGEYIFSDNFISYVKENGYEFNQSNRIGYWHNPNALFDSTTVGGRWAGVFIINKDVEEYIYSRTAISTSTFTIDDKEYRAVDGCRKKDFDLEAAQKLFSNNDNYFEFDYIIDYEGTFVEKPTAEQCKEYIENLADDDVIICIDAHI